MELSWTCIEAFGIIWIKIMINGPNDLMNEVNRGRKQRHESIRLFGPPCKSGGENAKLGKELGFVM